MDLIIDMMLPSYWLSTKPPLRADIRGLSIVGVAIAVKFEYGFACCEGCTFE